LRIYYPFYRREWFCSLKWLATLRLVYAGSRSRVYTSPSRHSIPDTAPDLEAVSASGQNSNWPVAYRAAESKKAHDLQVLDLRDVTSFTDFFLICSVTNPRQGQAVSDEIHKCMKEEGGELPVSVEGYDTAEWILMDYGDFLVHIFSEQARSFYDLERLWRHAKAVKL
jgi:ribosome-associated protein